MYTYSNKESVRKVKAKCRGCGAYLTIELFEGEATSPTIVSCEKCFSTNKKEENYEED